MSAPQPKRKRSKATHQMDWFVYFLRCADGSLYCGITNALAARFLTHNSGKGAKYTRARRPVRLVYAETVPDFSAALKREYQLKQLSKHEKEALCRMDSQ